MDWCWSWNSNSLATWCEELTHLKRPWFWERLRADWEGDDRGWDDWMASPPQWTRVLINSGSWWWTGSPGVLRFLGSQRVGQDWVTELNWIQMDFLFFFYQKGVSIIFVAYFACNISFESLKNPNNVGSVIIFRFVETMHQKYYALCQSRRG